MLTGGPHKRSFSFYAVVTLLIVALASAIAGAIALVLRAEAFPLFALSGGAYVGALAAGGRGVLFETRDDPAQGDPALARGDSILNRIGSMAWFALAVLQAWSRQFPALNPVYADVIGVALALAMSLACGSLLLRTLRRYRRRDRAAPFATR